MIELKKRILEEVESLLTQKAVEMREQLAIIREDASSSAKSSMGDKYETTKEMLKQEELKIVGQLEICEKQLKDVQQINPGPPDRVSNGKLIRSDKLYFMILTSIGKITVDNQEVFVVSAAAPIARLLLNKQVGDTFDFNRKSCQIDELV